MNRFRDAIRIFHTEGATALVIRTLAYFRYVLATRWWRTFYRSKATVTGNHTVTIAGITLDTSVGLSPAMVRKLRSRRYETDETHLIRSALDPRCPVIDLGAGIGFTATLAERYTDPSNDVVAVEANPDLVPVLRRTRELNDSTFTILSTAYGSTSDPVTVHTSDYILSSSTDRASTDDAGSTVVESTSLREIVRRCEIDPPFQLLVDIEGGERDLISNEIDLLARSCLQMFVEFHPSMGYEVSEYLGALSDAGFEVEAKRGDVYLLLNTSIEEVP